MLDPAFVLRGQFVQDRGEHAAGAAPFGPEIHQDRDRRVEDLLGESGLVEGQNVGSCHECERWARELRQTNDGRRHIAGSPPKASMATRTKSGEHGDHGRRRPGSVKLRGRRGGGGRAGPRGQRQRGDAAGAAAPAGRGAGACAAGGAAAAGAAAALPAGPGCSGARGGLYRGRRRGGLRNLDRRRGRRLGRQTDAHGLLLGLDLGAFRRFRRRGTGGRWHRRVVLGLGHKSLSATLGLAERVSNDYPAADHGVHGFLGAVVSGKSSVRNGDAGRPSC